jgi:hypothetical protein
MIITGPPGGERPQVRRPRPPGHPRAGADRRHRRQRIGQEQHRREHLLRPVRPHLLARPKDLDKVIRWGESRCSIGSTSPPRTAAATRSPASSTSSATMGRASAEPASPPWCAGSIGGGGGAAQHHRLRLRRAHRVLLPGPARDHHAPPAQPRGQGDGGRGRPGAGLSGLPPGDRALGRPGDGDRAGARRRGGPDRGPGGPPGAPGPAPPTTGLRGARRRGGARPPHRPQGAGRPER